MSFTRLTPTMAAQIAAQNRRNVKLSKNLREAHLIRRALVQELRALHWSHSQAGELADIHMQLREAA